MSRCPVSFRFALETGTWAALCLSLSALEGCEASRSPEPGVRVESGAAPESPYRPLDDREFCGRSREDVVRDLFCQTEPPDVRSLKELQDRLGMTSFLGPDGGLQGDYYGSSATGAPSSLVLLGHSTALSGRLVSPINPRAILLSTRTFLAFNRGVQQVEIATRDRRDYVVNFYLVSFEQACNAAPGGCVPGDLYTPRIESDWSRVRIKDDEDLKNTPSDCRQCHQRGLAKPIILMRELDGPWTHFFMPDSAQIDFPEPSGIDLMRDYLHAKGDEPYAGMPPDALRNTVGITLENSTDAEQPIIFDGSTILNERWPWSPAGYLPEAVPSATWQRDYEAFKRGELLALPFYAPRATDPDKQARLTAVYQQYLAHEIAAEDLPDLADIFPDAPQLRAEIGLQTEPGATPAQALVQACGTCHNDVLDQTISRARFNIALSRMSRAELDVAVQRLTTNPGVPGAMPPSGRRELDAETRDGLIQYLRTNSRTSEDDAFLEHAATVGMAGKQPRPSIFAGGPPPG
jgi:hypothetical protein